MISVAFVTGQHCCNIYAAAIRTAYPSTTITPVLSSGVVTTWLMREMTHMSAWREIIQAGGVLSYDLHHTSQIDTKLTNEFSTQASKLRTGAPSGTGVSGAFM